MNKTIFIAVAFFVMFSLPAMADPTTTDVWWNGGGTLDIDFAVSDDMTAFFDAAGAAHMGEFHGKNFADNPYTYGVETASAFVKATLAGFGTGSPDSFMQFQVDRLDSATGGPAGQQTYSYVETDGAAEMAFGSRTNYDNMTNAQYGWVYSGSAPYSPTTGGVQFEAFGNHYIEHRITDSDADGAMVQAWGYGPTTSQIKCMGEKSRGSSFNMARLPICGDGIAWDGNYAKFNGSGDGQLHVSAWAHNGITVGASNGTEWTIPGDGTSGSATYDLNVNYAGTWGWSDFGVSGN
jgi:hypothetical protein